jgi:hypothetical protein
MGINAKILLYIVHLDIAYPYIYVYIDKNTIYY